MVGQPALEALEGCQDWARIPTGHVLVGVGQGVPMDEHMLRRESSSKSVKQMSIVTGG